MVAIIKTSTSIQRALAYNENKVKQGVAQCLAAVNYPKDADDLSFSQKLNLLTRQLALNERVTRGSVHISLNFDPSEKLSKETMIGIAQVYMDKIGFGEQPCLVYQHQDAAHPHIHIVSINIRADGSRIDMFNIGRNQSENARKQIEKQFGLVQACASKKKLEPILEPVNATKAVYGKDQTKQAIETVLGFVLKHYRYTSLAELNAVLGKYNVLADRGSEHSQVFVTEGLVYRLLDQKGDRVGVPIKASELKGRPTLKLLESHFAANRTSRKPHQSRLQTRIDWALARPDLTLKELVKTLANERIDLVQQQNAQGLPYGITYIDHQSRCVFKGSDLGKAYSASAIAKRFGYSFSQKGNTLPGALAQSPVLIPLKKENTSSVPVREDRWQSITLNPALFADKSDASAWSSTQKGELPSILMQTENTSDYVPNAFRKANRKRKKRKANPASNKS